MQWFRMYAEFLSDPVVQSLAFEDQRHYVAVLCLKCNGTLDREIAPKTRDRIIYRGIGLDPLNAEEAKRRLMEVGLIDKKWQPKGWDKRQYKSDDVTERTRNHRKNKESQNVPETLQERDGNPPDTEQIQNRTDTPNSLRSLGGARERAEPKRKRQLPDDFTLTTDREAVLRESVPDADALGEFAQFTDHHRSRGNAMLDWDAAWRTWCRNAARFQARGATNGRRYEQPTDAILRAYHEEQREIGNA